MSSFFAINIGRSALMTNQAAIETAGHNVANVNTEGYSRQRVVIDQAVTLVSQETSKGSGVNVREINRVHEVFLERQIARSTNQSAFDAQMVAGLEEMQTIINEPSENSISNALSEFWNSWESLSLRPTDAGLRGQVVEAAERLARDYNNRIQAFLDAEKGFNDEIKNLVEYANELSGELARMNQAIFAAESGGSSANDLRDQRDRLVKQLSELIGIEPIEEGNYLNIRFPDGGPYLIQGPMSLDLVANTDVNGWVTGVNLETKPLQITTGRIGAYLELRDKVSPDLRAELSEMMARITDRVNELHRTGYDAELRIGEHIFEWSGEALNVTTYPSSGIFEAKPLSALQAGTHYIDVVSVDQATLGNLLKINDYGTLTSGAIDLSQTGGVYTGENVINLDYHVRVLESNADAAALGGLKIQLFRGDEAVSDAITLTDASPTSVVFNVDGVEITADLTLGASVFVKGERSDGLYTTGRVSMDGGVAVALDLPASNVYNLLNGGQNGFITGGAAKITFDKFASFDGSTFTAVSPRGFVSINSMILADLDRIAAALPRNSTDGPAPGDGELARRIASLATEKIFEYTGETATVRLGSIVQGLGEQSRQAKVFEQADKSILAQLEAQRQSFSGVNLDEEMVLLIQFQRGFEASARFVTAADQMIDTIINRLGRVGL